MAHAKGRLILSDEYISKWEILASTNYAGFHSEGHN